MEFTAVFLDQKMDEIGWIFPSARIDLSLAKAG
jgi:hypothetical protein